LKLHIVLEKQKEGGYTVYIPELPGCVSQGETKAESLKNIEEAKELYLEELGKKKAQKAIARVSVIESVVS